MPERIETEASEFRGGVVPEVTGDKAVGCFMEGDGDDERQYPDRYVVKGDIHWVPDRSADGATLPCIQEGIAANRASASGRFRPRILRQAVVEPHPVHFLRDPDVLGRRKCVAVVEYGERDACRRAVAAPGKQPRSAGPAKDPVERFR